MRNLPTLDKDTSDVPSMPTDTTAPHLPHPPLEEGLPWVRPNQTGQPFAILKVSIRFVLMVLVGTAALILLGYISIQIFLH